MVAQSRLYPASTAMVERSWLHMSGGTAMVAQSRLYPGGMILVANVRLATTNIEIDIERLVNEKPRPQTSH